VRQHAMRAKHDIVMANPSVHLSVCLSDASIVSIWMDISHFLTV